ncbi:hypothetical protein [Couchioplanes caeruleus]|uniref:Uncharacterized protein n=2 Tax=Couchioplanes caeruleus TaxID=56438 RepID=A0A1K0GRR8_9ACTN|nr:hypothetical protein [Couchioplanes caeruleus]OJF13908.1 hypothetical protein BG844_12710 [Couchioplanes caeruleus subsp. caeruleus]ROP31530.1 hypothetical protein EDD30_4444 [Couchioplanes caeruleus]
MGGPLPDPFAGSSEWAPGPPRPVVPTPATMGGSLRGRRVLIGLPGHGWRADLRADEKVVQGSRTYVPVMPEGEWYRAEAEQTEVFAPLVPVERVWVEELGMADTANKRADVMSRLVSMDEPPRRNPVAALDADGLTGRRVVQILEDGSERRDLRAVTELHTSDEGDICARVTTELDWYRWSWTGKTPRTLTVAVHLLWLE